MPIKHYKQVRGRTIKDEKTGKKYSMAKTSKILSIPYNTIYGYATKYKCTTFAEILAERATRPYRGGFSNKKKKKHKTKFGLLTTREMLNIHPFKDNMTMECLSCRISVNGAMSDKIWKDMAIRRGGRRGDGFNTYTIPEPDTSERNVDCDFNRNTFCTRNGVKNKCKFYASCGDARAFAKKHHERYLEDGSCFVMMEEGYCDK